ncbi:MAG: tRNA ((37)-N6)-threonylcarbamoyltransferase complex dimerization subunit type 1 TsaB [Actinomycetota bacterium]
MLLSIDTSAGTSAAVFDKGCIGFAVFEDPFGHAENVGLAIQQALEQSGRTIEEITAIAVGRGPAPYTGLRVGMAAATALAKANGLPLHGVITLDAIAYSANSRKLLVITDAKRKELFAATYESGKRLTGPMLLTAADLDSYSDFEILQTGCDARLIGEFAVSELSAGGDLRDLSALYLRSPDVTPSPGKKVSG